MTTLLLPICLLAIPVMDTLFAIIRRLVNKKPIDMDIYECTLLAGIPNAPSVYAPTKNLDLAEQRQKQVFITK